MKKLVFALLLTLYITTTQAQTMQKTKIYGFHEHDGFFSSISIGPNFTNVNSNDNHNYKLNFTGTGTQFDIKIGGVITEDFILHGTLVSSSLLGPKISDGYSSAKTSRKIQLGEVLIGGGFTYYLMPANYFVSASLGIGGFTVVNEEENTDISTDRGLGLQFKVGKEWWVSKNWALGLGVTYSATSVTNNPDDYTTEKITSNNWAIVFNATFN